MIWLASFPRSGNTFFRNVLFEVYGIRSSTYHHETTYSVDEDYDQYQVVKTHLLPSQVEPKDPSIKSVYIVRDGRDALVSIAHHRQDIVAPNSDLEINLLEAIMAMGGSHFGGWSENVRQWTKKADIIIRFKDLIEDPIREIEKLRSIMNLPQPQRDKLPTFEYLKTGIPEYGSAKKYIEDKDEQKKHASKSFRKGKVGGWKEEMTPEMQKLFWDIHGEEMHNQGYSKDKIPLSNPLVSPYKILIEANKTLMPGNDGVKRYLLELLNGISIFQELFPNKWEIDLYMGRGKIIKNNKVRDEVEAFSIRIEKHQRENEEIIHTEKPYENKLLALKARLQQELPSFVYDPLSKVYGVLPFRYILKRYREKITKRLLEEKKVDFEKYDLIHIPLPQHFHFLKDVKSKFLVTVHDLTHKLFPEFHTADNIQLSEDGMQEILNKKAAILAISESTKNDILIEYPTINKNKISVIHEACDLNHFKPILDQGLKIKVLQKYGLPDIPYFLSLSTIEPRKNLINTIKAFDKMLSETNDPSIALFICGKKGWKTEALFTKENLSSKNVYFTGFVDEADLPTLYSNALALSYVSLYEGFGLPPLEAMACGTTVIYGDNSSMPEVIGDAGLASDPNDVEDIKQNMKYLLDKEIRVKLEQKAIKRAFQFSWLKTAWKTLSLYERNINAR